MMRMMSCLMVTSLFFLTLSMQDVIGQFLSSPPSIVLVNETDPLSLECFHDNTTNITWQHDGILINGDSDGYVLTTMESGGGGVALLNISSASVVAHNGSYACVATLQDGMEDTTVFSIIVQFIGAVSINVITEQCARGNIYAGSTVTLECVISEAQPEVNSITWYRIHDPEQLKIDASASITFSNDNRRLDILGAGASDTGMYLCSGRSEEAGLQRESNIAMVTVVTAIPTRSVSLNPEVSSLIVREGNKTTIKCIIFPPSPPFNANQVVWRRNGENTVSDLDAGVSIFSHPCNGTLLISSTSANNTGTYTCHLEEVDGTTVSSGGLTLSLARIPQLYSIEVNPDVDVLGVGKSIFFLCQEDPEEEEGGQDSGNVEVEIRWQIIRDGVTSAVNGGGERVQVGARSLTITSLSVEDSGTYVCVAYNSLVTPVFTYINLTVEVPPGLSLSLSLPIRLETPALLTCTTNSSRLTQFSWFVNGGPLLPSHYLTTTTTTTTTTTLNITSVSEADLGANITCTATQALHLPITASVSLREDNQTYLVGNRRSQVLEVRNDTHLVLHCPLRGGATSVQWYQGKREIGPNEGVMDGLNITFHQRVSLNRDDRDQYSCKTSDGDDLRYNITLFITVEGNITSFPPPTTALVGSRVSLDCEVSGRPLPQVRWQRLNMDLQNVVNGSLIFEAVQLEDMGRYTCYIQEHSRGDVITHGTELMVVEPEEQNSIFNRDEQILVFSVVGVVALLFILCPVAVVIIGCYWLQRHGGHYGNCKVPKECYIEGEGFSKQSSLSRKEEESSMGRPPPPNPIFNTFQYSRDSSHFSGDEGYGNSTHVPSNVVPMETVTVGSASLLSDSHASSPMRGSIMYSHHEPSASPLRVPTANTSFCSEAHTVLENGQPCFSRNNLRLGDLMGQGEFGPVMKAVARYLVPGQFETEVAVKILVSESVVDPENGFRADLAIMDYANQMKLENKHVSSILGLCSDKEPFYVIYEYLDQGDLKGFLMESRPEAGAPPILMDYDLMNIINQVADGMSYLFSQRIIHGDIASRNCLISSKLNVKIGDLGIGHELYPDDYHDNGAQLLPIRWMPPELLTGPSDEGPNFSLQSDVWSFGVFCWEVISLGKLPYNSYSDEEVLVMIPAGSRLRAPSQDCPHQLYLIMMDCWNEMPERRPEFSTVISQLATIDLNQ